MTPYDRIIHHKANTDGQAYPPNSIEAIRACLDANAACIEIDIHALAHDDYLLTHDHDLTHETTGNETVGQCTIEEARKLHFKAGSVDGGERYHVPLLSEVINALRDYGGASRLQLDFKNVFPFPSDEPLYRLIRLIEPLSDRIIVSSLADWQLRKLRRFAPRLELGFDPQLYLEWRDPDAHYDPRIPPFRLGAYGYYDDHILSLEQRWSTEEYLTDRCESLARQVPNVSTLFINHHLLAKSLDNGFNWADTLHAQGLKLAAWTLDAHSPIATDNARRLVEAGVDLFTSNTPDALLKHLNGAL